MRRKCVKKSLYMGHRQRRPELAREEETLRRKEGYQRASSGSGDCEKTTAYSVWFMQQFSRITGLHAMVRTY